MTEKKRAFLDFLRRKYNQSTKQQEQKKIMKNFR